ncbi:hypothetical protein AAHE18_15G194700 [Arachis hypogaea]
MDDLFQKQHEQVLRLLIVRNQIIGIIALSEQALLPHTQFALIDIAICVISKVSSSLYLHVDDCRLLPWFLFHDGSISLTCSTYRPTLTPFLASSVKMRKH